jgi:D-alanine--(R)-lactate ligase
MWETAMSKVRVGILFGGRSEEHPISVKSAREVANHLDLDRFDPCYIGIARDGSWRLCESPHGDWESQPAQSAVLSPDPAVKGLLVLDGEHYVTRELDVVWPVLHGRYGEDGAIQGLLELSGIPYVGCDVPSSAVCMDKSLAYLVAQSSGIATPQFWVLEQDDDIDADMLPYPVFVKPARSGSSFGVTRVDDGAALPLALETARQYDTKVLIEAAVAGDEIGCAILGDGPDLTVGEVDRIALSSGFFRVHQESQPESGSENSTHIVPADISPETRRRVQETAKAIYRALGCTGIARVDMFVTNDGTVVLNEVNTMPGLTSYSRYPRMMAAAQLPLSEVIGRLVTSTLAGRRR